MRIRKQDIEEYRKIRQSILRKINYTKKEHNIDLSNEIQLKALENMTRQEFNAFKEQARSFTRKGNPNYSFVKINDHVSISRTEYQQLERLKKISERVAKERFDRIKDKPFFTSGKEVGKVGDYVQKMKDADIPGIKAPNVKELEKIRNREYIQNRIIALDRYTNIGRTKELNNTLKQNFLRKYEEMFNEDDFDDDLFQTLNEMDPYDFLDMYSMSEDMDFNVFYLEDDDLYWTMKENMTNHINSYVSGHIDSDFKRARENLG